MARTITAAMLTALQGSQLSPIFLFEVELPSGVLNLWTGRGNLAFDSKTWSGIGQFGGIASVTETDDIVAGEVTFYLTGVAASMITDVRGAVKHGTDILAYYGALDSTNALIVDPFLIFKGKLDTIDLSEQQDTATISVVGVNDLVDLLKPRERRYTDQDQQDLFTGDTGLRYMISLQNKEVFW